MKGLLRCPSTRIGAVALFAIASSCIVNSACSARGSKQAVRHITYWEKWTGFEGEAMDAVVADFNALELAHAKSDPACADRSREGHDLEARTETLDRHRRRQSAGSRGELQLRHRRLRASWRAQRPRAVDRQVELRSQPIHRALLAPRRVPRSNLGLAHRARVHRARAEQATLQGRGARPRKAPHHDRRTRCLRREAHEMGSDLAERRKTRRIWLLADVP